MILKEISISDLIVNRANDRHGELENETAAISWLFNTRETHMKNLANDIVAESKIYEPPLVAPENEKFVVFDGNRRVTCLKVLEKPGRAPTLELQQYFTKLRNEWSGPFPKRIFCQVEEDRDHIDNILYRRHTGTLSGVGQSNWDDRMKDNFVARSGKAVGFNVADEIESRLREAGLLPEKKIPRSNLNRFLSAEIIRNRIGFSVKKKTFSYTHKPRVVLGTFQRLADDFSNGRIVLGDIWDNEGKLAYVEKLEAEGVLPSDSDFLNEKGDSDKLRPTPPKSKPKPKPKPKPTPTRRTTLIPQKDFGILWTGKQQRHHAIWEELQFHLNIEQHPNAVSVLFRVLLELAIEHYSETHRVSLHQNDKLAKRVEKVGSELFSHGKIDKKQHSATKKFSQLDQLVSADTLNRYVHSPSFAPSAKHLEALWDTMADFIVACLKG
ncbi:MAG: hypothetical protein CMM86_11170 [Rhodovulum sp.]|jgi:hypothetical protein|nr:hypothetical protein [Rhodovulum sp.]|tara:strand:+ start:4450 stop:5766 length:1317 start_codon:yes stop_codon:yes gene_type:complete